MVYKPGRIKKVIILLITKFGNFIPDYIYLKLYSYLRTGRSFNLKEPKTFSEKINWLKLNERKPIMTKCSDKYKVREYVKEKLGEEYLIPLLWHGDKSEDIPFESLPKSFVIKTNHASGTNIIVKDKNNINKSEVIAKLNKWLKKNYYYPKREWAYKNIERKIIIEEFIGIDGKVPRDYKFFVFNGSVQLIQVDHDREEMHSRSLYDIRWQKQPYTLEFQLSKTNLEKPELFNELITFAEKLGEEFKQARVDFYIVNNRIYFGEITFYHGAGFERFIPNDEKWNRYYGELIEL